MSLDDLRNRIDEIDHQLVELLNERARVVVEIGKLKNKRASFIEKIKALTRDIKETKGYRDELNRIARAPDTLLMEIYQRDVEKLLEKDMPIEDEVRLFDKNSQN